MSETAQAEMPDSGADASLEQPSEADAKQARRYELAEAVPESEVESPPAEDENLEEKTESESDSDVEKESNAVQKRIDKLTRRFRDTERDAELLRAENERLQKELQASPQQTEQVKTLADFEYDENAYKDYLFGQAREIARREAQSVAQEVRSELSAKELATQFTNREKDFESKHEDYRAVAYDPSLPISKEMAEEIKLSSMGPDILYHLGLNEDLAAEISRLPAREVARRIARIEIQLESANKQVSSKVSKAPPPPPKVKATEPALRVAASAPESDKMSDREWLQRREAELAKRRR